MADEITSRDDAALDRLLAAGRNAAPAPGADFLARLEADAETHLPRPAPGAAPRPVPTLGHRLSGWLTAGGLATAAAAGVWIGFAAPDTLNSLAGYGTTATATDDGFTISELVPTPEQAAYGE